MYTYPEIICLSHRWTRKLFTMFIDIVIINSYEGLLIVVGINMFQDKQT